MEEDVSTLKQVEFEKTVPDMGPEHNVIMAQQGVERASLEGSECGM
jgi:hypothetical protein